jgi:integrase
LLWSEVDLDAGTVAVYRSVRAKGDTKTRRSRRVLQLSARVVAALREHRRRQTVERLRAGDAWKDHGLVFCREDGTALDRWQVRRELGQITRAAGLGGSGLHASCAIHSCPSSARAMCRWRTSASSSGTFLPASPRRCTGTRSGLR